MPGRLIYSIASFIIPDCMKIRRRPYAKNQQQKGGFPAAGIVGLRFVSEKST